MFENNKDYKITDNTNIEEFFKILICSYEVKESRIFDLTKVESKFLLDRMREITIKKMKNENKVINKYNLNEGVLLNILFNKRDYDLKFDLVVAIFNRRSNKYKGVEYGFKINTLPEKQICIKNQEIINNIKEYDYTQEKEELENLVNMINKCIIA